jgi:hypothetical protein
MVLRDSMPVFARRDNHHALWTRHEEPLKDRPGIQPERRTENTDHHVRRRWPGHQLTETMSPCHCGDPSDQLREVSAGSWKSYPSYVFLVRGCRR